VNWQDIHHASSLLGTSGEPSGLPPGPRYNFSTNDPYDRVAPVQMVLPRIKSSRDFMESIRTLVPPPDALALWFLGQNGFLLKDASGVLIAIDPYLTDSCARTFAHLPFRVNRQLPVFIEPEDLDVDVLITTHSHQDHADPETLRRLPGNLRAQFLGPWESVRRYRECGIPASSCRVVHPNEEISLGGSITLRGTFALPTDNTDLNHMGVLLQFASGISFYNTGDTAYCDMLPALVPRQMDLCAICINGGYHNLDTMRAASLIKAIDPRVAIPCHYDMMVNNTANPSMFRAALDIVGSTAACVILPYYEALVYRRSDAPEAHSGLSGTTTAEVAPRDLP
jgi:L-ascorbate 6-phosphate lactonase